MVGRDDDHSVNVFVCIKFAKILDGLYTLGFFGVFDELGGLGQNFRIDVADGGHVKILVFQHFLKVIRALVPHADMSRAYTFVGPKGSGGNKGGHPGGSQASTRSGNKITTILHDVLSFQCSKREGCLPSFDSSISVSRSGSESARHNRRN